MSDQKEKGLTGISETARGFIGRSILFDKTQRGRDRVRFDIYCGETKPELNKYPVIRFCVGYDAEIIKLMRDARRGSLVKVWGWLSAEGKKDDNGETEMANGRVQLRETLILYKVEVLSVDSISRQLALLTNN